jgi:DNA-binding response OmpR family regulator
LLVFNEIEQLNLPLILISKNSNNNFLKKDFSETIKIPFTIIYFKKKLISLIAKNEFRKNSFIQLNEYIIDKNERKIKKNNLELYLSEKEINFLVMFSQNNNPISKDYVLKNVWNYSSDTETHTVETHIHRLRKKILEKFDDNYFIKNNKEGYFI